MEAKQRNTHNKLPLTRNQLNKSTFVHVHVMHWIASCVRRTHFTTRDEHGTRKCLWLGVNETERNASNKFAESVRMESDVQRSQLSIWNAVWMISAKTGWRRSFFNTIQMKNIQFAFPNEVFSFILNEFTRICDCQAIAALVSFNGDGKKV